MKRIIFEVKELVQIVNPKKKVYGYILFAIALTITLFIVLIRRILKAFINTMNKNLIRLLD
jgi:hypothetical protein